MHRFAEITLLSLVVAAFFAVGTRTAAIIKSAVLALRVAQQALVCIYDKRNKEAVSILYGECLINCR